MKAYEHGPNNVKTRSHSIVVAIMLLWPFADAVTLIAGEREQETILLLPGTVIDAVDIARKRLRSLGIALNSGRFHVRVRDRIATIEVTFVPEPENPQGSLVVGGAGQNGTWAKVIVSKDGNAVLNVETSK